MENNIKDVYFNPSEVGAYASLYSFLKNNKIKSRSDIEKDLLKLKTYTLFKPVRKSFPTRRYLVQGYKDIWNIDLLDMQRFHRKNKGLKYVLVCVEALSKQAYARGIKNKKARTVLEAFKEIVDEAGYLPRLVHGDRGNEFQGPFKKYLEENGAKLYHTFTDKGAILAERFNFILRRRLYAIMSHNNNSIWHTYLSDVLNSYNSTPNSRYNLPPNQVNEENQNLVWKRLYKGYVKQKQNQKPPKLSIGSTVRIARTKLTFEKGSTYNYSLETFKVIKIENTYPWTYRLADEQGNELAGGFYSEQLLEVHPDSLNDD